VKRFEDNQLRNTLQSARITSASWDEKDGKQVDTATLIMSGDWQKVTLNMFKVQVGSDLVDPTKLEKKSDGTYSIGFTPPAGPDADRPVSLVFQSANFTVPGLPTNLPKKKPTT
jgi:hypothetical protein